MNILGKLEIKRFPHDWMWDDSAQINKSNKIGHSWAFDACFISCPTSARISWGSMTKLTDSNTGSFFHLHIACKYIWMCPHVELIVNYINIYLQSKIFINCWQLISTSEEFAVVVYIKVSYMYQFALFFQDYCNAILWLNIW